MSKTRQATSDKRFKYSNVEEARRTLTSEVEILKQRKQSLLKELGTINTNLELKERALENMNVPAGALDSAAL